MLSVDASSAQTATSPPHPSHATYQAVRHFGSLDGLRALSVIAVIWHHTVGHDPRLPAIFGAGAQGVTLFFAISGFLIVTLLLREQQQRGQIDLRAFYIRRALRIFPLYYAVFLLYAALVWVLERGSPAGNEFFGNAIYFLTYTSNWFVLLEGRTIFYFVWSLAAEEQFYLVWPSIQRWLNPVRSLAIMLAFIACLLLLQWWGVGGVAGQRTWWQRAIMEFPLAICFGVVLAHLLHFPAAHRALTPLFGQRASSALWLAVFGALLSLPVAAVWVHLAAVAVVASCVCREDHVLAPVLRLRALVYMGSISYGMYLLHMLVKNVSAKLLSQVGLADVKLLVFVVTLLGAVLVAGISFKHFEAHFLRRKQHFSSGHG